MNTKYYEKISVKLSIKSISAVVSDAVLLFYRFEKGLHERIVIEVRQTEQSGKFFRKCRLSASRLSCDDDEKPFHRLHPPVCAARSGGHFK